MKTQSSKTQETVAVDDLEALLGDIEGPQESVETVETIEATEAVEETIEAATTEAPVKAKKAKKAKAPKAAKAPKEPKAPKAPKPAVEPKPKRICYGQNKVARINANVNPDFLVLTNQDAELEGDDLAAAQAATRDIIKGMGSKVKNRAANLLEYAAGFGPKLNNISTTALSVLARDGQITSGDKGNLHTALLEHPYAPAAARAMGNNTLNMMRQLKLLTLTAKGHYVANADSVLLSVMAGKQALAFPVAVAVEAPVVETAPEEVTEVA